MADDYYVYLHSRLNTAAPFYIGKGRAGRCICEHNRNRHWRHIVAKDGGFVTSFLAQDIDEELATLAEIEAIDVYKMRGVALTNITNGGDGISGLKHSIESRAKMSAGMKGRVSSNKGKSMPAHVRATLVAAQAKRTNFSHSEETKLKIGIGNKGRKATSDQSAFLSKIRRMPVRCVDTGEVFDCALSAAQRFGANNKSLVWQCCAGLVKSAYGHVFEYLRRENGK